MLDIGKYEPRIPAELEGKVKGNYPSFVPRTDQERCQNILRKIFTDNKDSTYEVSTKLHGASFTAYLYNGKEGVCSRRWDLQVDDEKNLGNPYVRMYLDSNLPAALRSIGGNYAVQGELMGPGICKNRESLDKHILYIFDIYDIDAGTFLSPEDRHRMMATLYEHDANPELVHHVPIMALGVTMADLRISTVGELLAASDFPSISHEIAEGKIYKRMDGNFTFKVVSNMFLLKDEEGDDE
jgi:RNA ligase (TIGR02306 family)